ncbi:thymocyte selection-associated high mobility group box protein TOX [Platysternon megacephalum]|uniref:Thymocyte selection-associated high mobility group box protein TOX n=1 Tax=Platysternon megacephalum TaxID=55544 RepID=A0A4D9ERK2_9SAUR|nr:thymocyte selection-associated high mobility group box protein TOX [Platysternon megacephalum]
MDKLVQTHPRGMRESCAVLLFSLPAPTSPKRKVGAKGMLGLSLTLLDNDLEKVGRDLDAAGRRSKTSEVSNTFYQFSYFIKLVQKLHAESPGLIPHSGKLPLKFFPFFLCPWLTSEKLKKLK